MKKTTEESRFTPTPRRMSFARSSAKAAKPISTTARSTTPTMTCQGRSHMSHLGDFDRDARPLALFKASDSRFPSSNLGLAGARFVYPARGFPFQYSPQIGHAHHRRSERESYLRFLST